MFDRDIPCVSNDLFSYPEPDASPPSALYTPGSPWDMPTPPFGRESTLSMEPDEMPFGTPPPYPSATIQDGFYMAESHDTVPVYLDQNLLYPCDGKMSDQSMMGYSTPSYDDSYGLFDLDVQSQTGLDLDMYPMPTLDSLSMSMNFVVPSQTVAPSALRGSLLLRELKPLPIHNPGNAPIMNTSSKFHIMPSNHPRSATRLSPLTRTPSFYARRPEAKGNHLPTVPGPVPGHVRVQNKAIKRCDWPGCNKRFQRQEHLKRHEKTHMGLEPYVCQFCQKTFGRSDNLKSHTRLHLKKTPRTQFFPEAESVYEEMSRKPRRVRDPLCAPSGRSLRSKL